VSAHIARQVEQFVAGEIGGRNAVQHLLIGRIRRFWRAPVLADQRLDRRAVDDVEAVERAGAGEARIDRGRVDHQHVFQQHAQPGGEGMAPVGAIE
jgi:hypothetical protein